MTTCRGENAVTIYTGTTFFTGEKTNLHKKKFKDHPPQGLYRLRPGTGHIIRGRKSVFMKNK